MSTFGADNIAVNPDRINYPNINANIMSIVCIGQSMVVVNTSKFNEKYYISNLTYSESDRWVSEVCVFIAFRKLLCSVESFSLNNDPSHPSDD